MLTTVIYSMQVFGQVYVMTSGGPNYSTLTFVQYLYIKAFRESKLGYAAAIGVILFIIILLLSVVIYGGFLDRDEWRIKRSQKRRGKHEK
ncbi:MAG: carbohydrate ABC transporter permease [Eisenbergiella sp.]